MTAAEVSPQLPGWAEPVGLRPRPRFGRLRTSCALTAIAVLSASGVATRADAGPAPAPMSPPDGYPGLLARPVDGKCWYTDTWGDSRPGGRMHEGVDIGADAGVPLLAVTDGVIAKQYVDKPGWRGGNAIRLSMPDGTYFFYGHMSAFGAGIAPGVSVTAGTVIGYVGMTGNAGANHLHFEVHPRGGAPINPYPLAKAYGFCSETGRAKPAPAPTTAPGPVPAPTPTDPAPTDPAPTGAVPVPPTDAPDPGQTSVSPTDAAAPTAAVVLEPVEGGTPECLARYLVKPGDYWYYIAAATRVKPSRLAGANRRTIDSYIYPDERLCIPDPSWIPPKSTPTPLRTPTTATGGVAANPGRATAPTTCSARYQVNRGDYWYMLAAWFRVRVSTLAAANGRTIESPIHPGESICIP